MGRAGRGVALVAVYSLVAAAALLALAAAAPFMASRAVALLNFYAEGFVWLVQALGGGLDGWALALDAGRAAGRAVSTPGVTGGIILVEMAAVAALWALNRLLRVDRDPESKAGDTKAGDANAVNAKAGQANAGKANAGNRKEGKRW